MLVGRIRPTSQVKVTVEGNSLEEVQRELEARRPEGFDLVHAPVRMRKGSITLDCTGVFAARTDVREIEAEDMAALRAKVPDGWQLLSVLS